MASVDLLALSEKMLHSLDGENSQAQQGISKKHEKRSFSLRKKVSQAQGKSKKGETLTINTLLEPIVTCISSWCIFMDANLNSRRIGCLK